MKADLHMHTNFSDGTNTPSEMVARAAGLQFDVIAITDHDTVAGVSEALQAGEEIGIQVVPGVEITAQFHHIELHMLAYFSPDDDEGEGWQAPELLDHLKEYSDQREKRAEQIVRRLNDLGMSVTMDEVHHQANSNEAGTLGRPHIAAALVAKNYVSSLDQAFSEYLKKGRPAWVDKRRADARDIIALVHRAGGIVSLAHPGLLRDTGIPAGLCSEGIDGVEVYHSRHTSEQSKRFRKWAEENDLIVTGGSDCHGMLKGEPLLGRIELRDNDLERFLAKLN
jgi:predicted metal-dependent phosphoesterase TrpH